MKLRAVIIAVLVSWSSLAQARPGADARLTALERRWVAALVGADTRTLDRVLADSYVDTDESGARTNKAGVIGALTSGALKMTSIQLSQMRVQLYGRGFAVVTGVAAQRGAFEGKPVAPKILYTDTFVLTGGAWRAVASQRTAAPIS